MRVNLFKIFSELVTGIACISVILFFGYLSKTFDVTVFKRFVTDGFNFFELAGVPIVIYFIGFIVDGIGLGLGELFLDNLLCKRKSTKDDRKRFFRKVSEYVFEYRNRQWAYYSSYRNMFLLTILLLASTTYHVFKNNGLAFGIIYVLIILVILILIWQTMKMLLKLYYSIEESFPEEDKP